jgi:hypothetical protein
MNNLNPSDKICDECNGTGYIIAEKRTDGGTIAAICRVCDGDGKFDWVEIIVGKKPFVRKRDKMIVSYYDPPSNPEEEDFYYDLTLKSPMLFRDGKWKPFDYFGAEYEVTP